MSANQGAVVVGIDGSPDGERGLDWAIAEAAGRGLPLHVVHTLPPLVGDVPLTADEYREGSAEGDRLLAEAGRRAAASGVAPVSTEFAERSPMPVLVDASRGAAALVVGARGHGPLFGLLLGSVSGHVAAHAHCPVVVVREAADRGARRIVVGVDGSAGGDEALAFAVERAARTGTPLVAVHAWRDRDSAHGIGGPDWSRTVERIDAGNRLLDEALARWRDKYPEVEMTREAVPVHPARALADASGGAALLVVGARGHGGFAELLLGSVVRSVLHHARCPVVVVH